MVRHRTGGTQIAALLVLLLPVAVADAGSAGTAAASQGESYYTISPCRLIDTRNSTGADAGAPALVAGQTRVFAISGKCGLPSSAEALTVNVTVTSPTASGNLKIYRADLATEPNATNISFAAGATRANNAIVGLAADGSGIKVLDNSAGSVHFVLDVNGYFSSSSARSEITVYLPGGIPLTMMRIPAGTFQMGSPETERGRAFDETLHTVTLTEDYYLAKNLVTQAQWQAVTGTPMSTTCGRWGVGVSHPVYCVSWDDIRGSGGFLEKLNAYLASTGQPGAGKFRLPTEAEWERAARGGTQTRFSFGDALAGDDTCGANAAASPYVWWCQNTPPYESKPVGTKLANQYGLFDMHGNMREWVEDWYGTYPAGPVVNPTGPSTGFFRLTRSGAWSSDLARSRSASRGTGSSGSSDLGFRPAMPFVTPPPQITSFMASPSWITAGQSSTLTWTSTDGTTASIDGTPVALNGSVGVKPGTSTTYTLTVSNSAGFATKQVTVTVISAAPVITSFTANPTWIPPGQSSTLSWTSTGGTTASLNGTPVAVNGSVNVTPSASTLYTLTVSNSSGSTQKQVTVTVASAAPTINSFTATPASIPAGQSSTLSWTSTGGTSASINGTPVAVSGSVNVMRSSTCVSGNVSSL